MLYLLTFHTTPTTSISFLTFLDLLGEGTGNRCGFQEVDVDSEAKVVLLLLQLLESVGQIILVGTWWSTVVLQVVDDTRAKLD